MVICSTTDYKRIEIENFITHRSWKNYPACLKESHGRSRQKTNRGRTWGTCLFSGQQVECFGVPKLKPDYSNQKSRILVSHRGVLFKGYIRGNSWVTQVVDHWTLAQVIISLSLSLSPATGSVLMARVWSLLRVLCLPLSLPLPCLCALTLSLSLSLSLLKINIKKNLKIQILRGQDLTKHSNFYCFNEDLPK